MKVAKKSAAATLLRSDLRGAAKTRCAYRKGLTEPNGDEERAFIYAARLLGLTRAAELVAADIDRARRLLEVKS